ncbi:non-ribosomal peptide synthetase [Streptomyces sp. HSW2009]|uniref:non-ribosomal peptide synthetase n=1 Tax=Streptomyces sp. HSW2009 TaxID=3142890 RepID=UPI0032EDF6D4
MNHARSIAPLPGANRPRWRHLLPMLRSQSERRPDAVAIEAPGHLALTYRLLYQQVERTVRTLRTARITPADRVALALPHGPAAAVATLAIGCAAQAAPLDPACRAAEFDTLLTALGATAGVVEARRDSLAPALAPAPGRRVVHLAAPPGGPAGSYQLICGDEELTSGRVGRQRTVPRAGAATDPAFALHTSGTTGRPKLVSLTHAAVCTSAHNSSLSLDLTEHDRCLNVTPLCHSHGLMGPLLASLWAGGSIVVPPGFDAAAFPGWLDGYAPTWYSAVPAVHQAIVDALAGRPRPGRRGPLRFVRSASSPLPTALAQRMERTLGVPVIDAYGMTEACSVITVNPLPPGPRKPGSVGVSTGPEVAAMGADGRLLPAGGTGEIVLRGPTVIRGYAPHPAAPVNAFAHGWFHTGDLGHVDADGYLFLTGRLGEVIRRGGVAVSPIEVDRALLAHPAVLDAAAFPLPHPTLGQEVAAAVVVRERDDPSDEEFRIFLAGRLAADHVPRRIFRTTAVPRTATGKVHRAGLAARVLPGRRSAGQPLGGPLQQVIAGVWAELLGTDRFGPRDHFFDLGGDAQLIQRAQVLLREATGHQVPIAELFARLTVESLSAYFARPPGGPPAFAPPPGPPAEPTDPPVPGRVPAPRQGDAPPPPPYGAPHPTPGTERLTGHPGGPGPWPRTPQRKVEP